MGERTKRSRDLRINATDAEKKVWQQLRLRNLSGYKFRRQHPIGNYIVDFVCLERKLIVELDGGQHQDSLEYDSKRSERLEGKGYRVIRFWDNEALQDTDAVIKAIFENLATPP